MKGKTNTILILYLFFCINRFWFWFWDICWNSKFSWCQNGNHFCLKCPMKSELPNTIFVSYSLERIPSAASICPQKVRNLLWIATYWVILKVASQSLLKQYGSIMQILLESHGEYVYVILWNEKRNKKSNRGPFMRFQYETHWLSHPSVIYQMNISKSLSASLHHLFNDIFFECYLIFW